MKIATCASPGTIEAAGRGGHVVPLPFDGKAAFGEARPPVQGTVNGRPLRTRLAVYGGVTYLGLAKAFLEEAGLSIGDSVGVELERDDAPREVELPPELEAALADPEVRAAFDQARRSRTGASTREWVAEAKRPETRERRVTETVRRTPGVGSGHARAFLIRARHAELGRSLRVRRGRREALLRRAVRLDGRGRRPARGDRRLRLLHAGRQADRRRRPDHGRGRAGHVVDLLRHRRRRRGGPARHGRRRRADDGADGRDGCRADDVRHAPRRGRAGHLAGAQPHRRRAGQRAGQLAWNELLSRDVDGAKAFLRAVFGLDPRTRTSRA